MNRNCKYENYGSQRVGIFIDTHNLYITCKELFNSKIDYEKLLPFLANQRDVVIAKSYLVVKDEDLATSFIDALQHSGFDVRIKHSQFTKEENGETRKRKSTNWGVGIALDIVTWLPKLDVVILASGDGCHLETIQYLKISGVRTEVASFESYTSKEMMRSADEFIELGPEKGNGNSYPAWLKQIEEKESIGNR